MTRQPARTLLLAMAVLAGCAAVPRDESRPEARVVRQDAFEVDGRFSARRGQEGAAGRFTWTHAEDADTIVFSTPTGQALARLSGDAQGVRLELPDGRTENAPDWERLTDQALGAPIPVRGLAFWLRGMPRPGSSHQQERDVEGRVAVLRQDGWEIVYGYEAAPEPARLRMSYPEVELRLVVDGRR